MADGEASSMVGTALRARCRLSKCTRASAVRRGTGTSPRVTSVITARVPSEPQTSRARLKRSSAGTRKLPPPGTSRSRL